MLYKRGTIWWVKFKSQGRVIARSTGATNKKTAADVEKALRQSIAHELHIQRTGQHAHRTYQEALLRWIEEGAPKSMYSHARNTRPFLDPIKLNLVVPAAHEMKRAMLREGLSVQTVNRRLAVVRRVLNVAYREWDWLPEPLGQKIQLLSEKGMAREFYLSMQEVDQLVSAVPHKVAARVIELAAYTGLRKSELLSLTPENWHEPYLILPSKTKSKKPRSVPVIQDKHHLIQLPFRITAWEFRTAFECAREVIERPDIRFHDLRHTYASWLAQDPNIPLTAIRDLLGHSSLSVTSKYTHLRGEHAELVTEAISKQKKGYK